MVPLHQLNDDILKRFSNPINQQGMVLIIVLWIIMLIMELMVYLFSSTLLNSKLGTQALLKAQQLEAAEAGLKEGETQLAQQIKALPSTQNTTFFTLSPVNYADYRVTLHAVRLSTAFCFTPIKRRGYYYQVTATAHPIHSTAFSNSLTLQSTIALPTSLDCSQHLLSRQSGRRAWAQLHSS